MSPEVIGILVGLATYLGMRVIDLLLPKDHHFRFAEKWVARDDEEEKGGE